MQLINDATASVVEPGSMIHMVSGPTAGQVWRFERVIDHATDGHRVHVTRPHPKLGRIHREYHPRLFGCSVAIDVHWYADKHRLLRGLYVVASQTVLLTLGGIIAWLVAEYGNAEWAGLLAALGVHADG
ncbi:MULTISPECIES: hypothetical protein [Streptomyces]|uniref:Uncharacterized protein n=2 Tax=Streptomyces rapamycinicus TaxID=1226757 RepID=A0A0A0NMY7_STRRN|nr:hypothetical protein [Streptomyces rapamycinicus]AGP58329.1 hypothetical protein M271_34585 [Streptomyces rapamycinicus NRRL 5491]MBB4786021.1 hypothetical protein [Streptomyces rapamycinicus]RLV78516.1 hypothetical protein D3C57_109065 [Streptomyces rapamycinicus NRRL 5491]UTO66143.1 hypothetical protein LJB45_30035 [Streptomyces rapamycinicus]UTP34097.1 hypothetical protein LIV37_35170 [Streptomyces rapamycinicus NRRL 5491]